MIILHLSNCSGRLPMIRKNGFQLPFHPYQVISWIIYLCLIVVNILVIGLPLPSPYNIIFYILSTLLELIILVFGSLTTAVNPADDFSRTNVNIESWICNV